MTIVQHYQDFNPRRYSNPWIAIVDIKTGNPDFKRKIGGYTGAYGKGEEGDLYITAPVEGAVYTYGQKDYRGDNTERNYIQYVNGQLVALTHGDFIRLVDAAQQGGN